MSAPVAGPVSDTGGMPPGQIDPNCYQQLPVGGQLGHLEYLVTGEDLELYRCAVGYPEAQFPSLAAAEFRQILTSKYGTMPLISVRHQEWYYRPPTLERRVQVSGWIREKYRLHGRDWLVIGTLAVDDIGTEILRSRHTFVVGEEEPPLQASESSPAAHPSRALPILGKQLFPEDLEMFQSLARRLAPDRRWAVDQPTSAKLMCFAYLHELMASDYGIDFRQGGQLDVSFTESLRSRGKYTAHGAISQDKPAAHRTSLCLQVWLESQDGTTAAFGQAQVTIPSPLT